MATTLILSRFTFRSVHGSQTYTYDIVADEQSTITVENMALQGALGIQSCTTPQILLDDIQESIGLVQDLVAETQVATGTITFTGQTSNAGAILAGVLNNTSYRVVYTPPDDVLIRTENKTTTSFDAVVATTYGSVAAPKVVSFVVLVATSATSSFAGTETFVQADASTRSIVFPSAMASDTYRVILTPSDFFSARVVNKTRLGFTIELGITLGAVDTVDVGFDVFVG